MLTPPTLTSNHQHARAYFVWWLRAGVEGRRLIDELARKGGTAEAELERVQLRCTSSSR